MQLDPHLVHSILLAIEAKTSRTAAPLVVPGVDQQVLLDYLAAMYEEGLFSGPKPHHSSSTGEVDRVDVGDLTPLGRKRLQELDQGDRDEAEGQPPPVSAWGSSWGPPPGPRRRSDGAIAAVFEPPLPLTVQAEGAAGEIRPSIQNEVPQSSVSIGDSRSHESFRPSSRVIVLLQVDALLFVIRRELQRLRERRLNDDPEVRELEAFEERVVRLRDTTVDAEAGRVSPEQSKEAAKSFGSYLREWFDNHHDQILTDGLETFNGAFKTGVFLSATAICASLGVEVTLAATISGVLAGGAPVKEAIKAAADMVKKLKGAPPS